MLSSLSFRGSALGAVLRLSLPLMLSMALGVIQQTIDRFFLSHISEDALAASFPAGLIVAVLQVFFIGATAYVGTFAAQHRGADEHTMVGTMLWPSLIIAVIGGLFCGILIPVLPTIFNWYEVSAMAQEHMNTLGTWYCLAALPILLFNAGSSFLSGINRAFQVLLFSIVAAILNCALNALFVFGLMGLPEMGVAGAGLGTFLAQCIILIPLTSIVFGPQVRKLYHTWAGRHHWRPHFRRYIYYALPQSFRDFFELFSWQYFFVAIGFYGTTALAANNIAVGWAMFSFMPLIGISQGISIIVGENIGMKKPTAAHRATQVGLRFALFYSFIWSALFCLCTDPLIDFFIHENTQNSDDIRSLARLLLYCAAFWNVTDAVQYILRGACSGAGDTWWPSLALSSVNIITLVTPCYLVIHYAPNMADGMMHPVLLLWAISGVALFLQMFLMILRYRRGNWRHASVR